MIVVTRPSPDGEILTQRLIQANLPAMHLPFFNISIGADLLHLQTELNQLTPLDIVIVVSPQVSHIIKTNLPNLLFPAHISYFAIGYKSAELFKQLSQKNVSYPKQENSEGLLQLLDLQPVKNRTILILRGDFGRQLLTEELTQKGAKVRLLQCYRRKAIHYPANILNDYINKQIIVITSVEHLLQLDVYCHIEHKQHAYLMVTSPRIFAKATQLQWQKVLLVDNANNQTLFEALIALSHQPTTNLKN